MRRLALVLLLLAASVLAALTLLWPAITVSIEIFSHADWSVAGLSSRRITLLGRGLLIAVIGSAVAQVVGAGLAAGILDRHSRWRRSAAIWAALFGLLSPPYISAYAWSLPLLPSGIASDATLHGWHAQLSTTGRAVLCLAIWLAPLAAGTLACGWRVAGRPALALATQDATPFQAMWRLAPGVMAPWIAVSLVVCVIMALTEFTICHLCLIPTWNTEILAEIQNSPRPGAALLLAWPLLALVAMGVALLWPLRASLTRLLRDLASLSDEETPQLPPCFRAPPIATIISILIVVSPGLLLLSYIDEAAAWSRVWRTFPMEWPTGLLCAMGTVALSLSLAVGVDFFLIEQRGNIYARVIARVIFLFALAFALSPPALVGDAFVAAFPPGKPLGDSWFLVSLTTAARFAAIPMLALRFGDIGSEEMRRAASVDRASRLAWYAHVRLPLAAPTLLLASVVAGLFSLSEIAASQMTTPPGWPRLSVTLLNQIHFGRNADVIVLCLTNLVFTGVVLAIAIGGAKHLSSWGEARSRNSATA